MTIAEVSKTFGLTADTLRYYERIGLIPPVKRSSSGIRDYDEKDCNWVEFINSIGTLLQAISNLLYCTGYCTAELFRNAGVQPFLQICFQSTQFPRQISERLVSIIRRYSQIPDSFQRRNITFL